MKKINFSNEGKNNLYIASKKVNRKERKDVRERFLICEEIFDERNKFCCNYIIFNYMFSKV